MDTDFAALYEDWCVGPNRGSPALSQLLSTSYRQAWSEAEEPNRLAVVRYVYETREADGFDLIVAALSSEDFRVAQAAAASALALIEEGFDLGSGVRQAFRGFQTRFPQAEVFAWAAFQALDAAGPHD